MEPTSLTGAHKSLLRGLGQTREPDLKVGKGGLTPDFFKELARRLDAQELVKLRFLGADRPTRATLGEKIAHESGSTLAGTVGHTALFYRQNPDPARRTITLA